jgi:hypothetical protein
VKKSRQITLGSSELTKSTANDFTYSMRAKVISIKYSAPGSIHDKIERILRKIEYWHQGSITSYRILYQNAAGLRAGEVKWDGEKAEVRSVR